jgi:ankyrin repeat protein
MIDFLRPRMSNLKLTQLLNSVLENSFSDYSLKRLDEYCKSHSVNKANNEGILPSRVAFHVAPFPQVVELFIFNGLKINSRDNRGFALLHEVVTSGGEHSLEVLRLLLKHGADVNLVTNAGYNAAALSIIPLLQPSKRMNPLIRKIHEQCCLEILSVALEPNRSTPQNDWSLSSNLLLIAVDTVLPEVVKKLIESGIPVPNHDKIFREKHDPIMHRSLDRARWKNVMQDDALSILKILLDNGGNPNERLIDTTETLIDHAHGHKPTISLLKKYGAREDY